MNIRVVYHSSTGNTAKLAEAIGKTMKVKAQRLDNESLRITSGVDLLFLGDGVYFGKANKKTISFINQLDPNIVKNVAIFATYGGQQKIGDDLNRLLQSKGIHVISEPFTCKGKSWMILNRKHPNDDDIRDVREYAKRVLAKVKK